MEPIAKPSTERSRRVVVVGVDFSEESERAIDAAFEDASAHPGTEVHAVFVHEPLVDPLSGMVPAMMPAMTDSLGRLRKLLEAHVAKHKSLRVKSVVAQTRVGLPTREIPAMAAELGADLVVLGTHGRKGLSRWVMGSVAEIVTRRAPCAVLVVRAKAPPNEEPRVLPLCDDCARTRTETNGAQLWCARHSEHHPHAHVYSYEGPSTESARPWGFD